MITEENIINVRSYANAWEFFMIGYFLSAESVT
jgi:hypothetical protein